ILNEDTNKKIFYDESFSKIKFEQDDRIEQGGCVVETEIGNVDGRISSQFNELKKYFDSN
ncbi:MAG: FliH/SctL family protein, partial [Ignavibacteriaceae bacterium]